MVAGLAGAAITAGRGSSLGVFSTTAAVLGGGSMPRRLRTSPGMLSARNGSATSRIWSTTACCSARSERSAGLFGFCLASASSRSKAAFRNRNSCWRRGLSLGSPAADRAGTLSSAERACQTDAMPSTAAAARAIPINSSQGAGGPGGGRSTHIAALRRLRLPAGLLGPTIPNGTFQRSPSLVRRFRGRSDAGKAHPAG